MYFDIVRSYNGENIYSSPIIPIGSHLEDITLNKSLEAGEYGCVLTYHLLDENEVSISYYKQKRREIRVSFISKIIASYIIIPFK